MSNWRSLAALCAIVSLFGWRNRNIVKSANDTCCLTRPVKQGKSRTGNLTIHQTEIAWVSNWNSNHFKTLCQSYTRSSYFNLYREQLEELHAQRSSSLANFTIIMTQTIVEWLGINHTNHLRSSELHISGTKTERLVEMLKKVGATHYISGPAAKEYLDEDMLDEAGISLEYMAYNYPEYTQLGSKFEPQISVLDLIFMKDPESPGYIWEGAKLNVKWLELIHPLSKQNFVL